MLLLLLLLLFLQLLLVLPDELGGGLDVHDGAEDVADVRERHDARRRRQQR